jgi:putative flippase GtrA
MLVQPESRRRLRRFLLIGVLCFGVQYAMMRFLVAIGLSWPAASVVGFATSAQVNFALSNAITWGDRRRSASPLWSRWLSYGATALLGLAVNTAVFTATYRSIGSLPATASGVVAAALVTYLLCNQVVFRTVGPSLRGVATAPVGTPDRAASVAPALPLSGDEW